MVVWRALVEAAMAETVVEISMAARKIAMNLNSKESAAAAAIVVARIEP